MNPSLLLSHLRGERRWPIWAALISLAVLAAAPALLYGPPTLVDGSNHYYRLVELNWHVQHGDFYPRWFSDIFYGYGGPLLNFYPPLSYYLTLALHWVGLSLSAAFTGSFACAIAVGVVGMFQWARSHFDSPVAGIVASVAYIASPYLYYNVLIRGALPEAWGLAFAPWVLGSVYQLSVAPSRRTYAAFVVAYTALFLTHNLTSLLITPLILIYWIGLGRDSRTAPPAVRLKVFALGLIHVAALAAFYLLPFTLEAGSVGLQRAALDYRDHFIPLSDLFAWPIPFDPFLARNPYPLSLPLISLALAAVGVWALFTARSGDQQLLAVALTALLLVYAFFTLRLSETLWQSLTIGTLIQFPWRLLGPTMLTLAWLGGAAVTKFKNHAAWIIAAGLYVFVVTWSYRYPTERLLPDTGLPTDVIHYEQASPVSAGLTFQQEFLPKWVTQLPAPESMQAAYTQDLIPDRLAPVPSGVVILNQRSGLTSAEVDYQSEQPFTATLNIFYFPGWVATVDGGSTPAEPYAPMGLLSVSAPAGHHTLRVTLQPTAAQTIGTTISILAVLALLALIGVRPPGRETPAPVTSASLSWSYSILFLALLLLRVTALEWYSTPFKYSRLAGLPNPPAQSIHFGEQLALIGSALPMASSQPADQPIPLMLYWQALGDLTRDYHISLQLADAEGNRFGQSDQYPGLVPTGGWHHDQYLPDVRQLNPMPGTPPGSYRLIATVYSLEGGAPQPLTVVVDGQPAGIEYDVGSLTLTSGWPLPPGDLKIVEAAIAGDQFSVGDSLPFTLVWQTGSAAPAALDVQVVLSDQANKELASFRFPAAGSHYLSTEWSPNQLIRFPHSLILPPDLPAGPAHAVIRFVDPDGRPASAAWEMGEIGITVPERSFVIPPDIQRIDHDFNESIRLLGYALNPGSLTLYWQARQPVPQALTVFVHSFDAQNNVIGGQDSPPARAATSWLPGEVVADQRPAPAGAYFEVGLYNSRTGERVGEPYRIHP